MYDAVSVAKYIISYCMEKAAPVTNLKLQKLLYFLWIAFYNATGSWLFENEIRAWPLGPVVPDVYDQFCAYGGLPIRQNFASTEIHSADKNILSDAIDEFVPFSAYKLVDLTHAKGKPWDKVFLDGRGRGRIIPFEMIIEDECN